MTLNGIEVDLPPGAQIMDGVLVGLNGPNQEIAAAWYRHLWLEEARRITEEYGKEHHQKGVHVGQGIAYDAKRYPLLRAAEKQANLWARVARGETGEGEGKV